MPEIKLDEHHIIEYRPTPWDERVFHKKTIEITNLKFESILSGQSLVQKILEIEQPDICYGRFQADDFEIKKVMLEGGFFPVESQATLHVPSLEKYQLPVTHNKRILPLQEADEEDRKQVIKHTPGMFKFSRFHEDPFIDQEKADIRMQNWVGQMVEEGSPLLVYKMKEALTSFVFYETNDDVVTLKLGGSVEGRGMITPYFFGSVIDHFKNEGFKMLNGVSVSTANTGIFKVYLALNFELRNTYIDYHWHRES